MNHRPPGYLKNVGNRKRIAEYFDTHRDEELSFEDAAIKFGLTVSQVRVAIGRLVELNLVESVHVLRHPSKGRMS